MSQNISKQRPSSVNPTKFRAKRPNTANNATLSLKDELNSFLNTSTNLFLTSTTQPSCHPHNVPTSRNASFSLNLTMKTHQSPSRVLRTSQDHTEKDIDPNMLLNETENDPKKSRLRPALKLDSSNMHCYLYKYRQKRDALDEKIRQLVAVELDLNSDKLQLASKQMLDNSLIAKSIRNKHRASPKIDDLTTSIRTSNLLNPFLTGNSKLSATTSFTPDQSLRIPINGKMHNKEIAAQRPMSAQNPVKSNRAKSLSANTKAVQNRPQTALDRSKQTINTEVSEETGNSSCLQASGLNFSYETDRYLSLRGSTLRDTALVTNSQRGKSSSLDRQISNRPAKQKPRVLVVSIKTPLSPSDVVQGRSLLINRNPPPVIHSREHSSKQRLLAPRKTSAPRPQELSGDPKMATIEKWTPSLEITGRGIDTMAESLFERSFYNPRLIVSSKNHGYSFEAGRERYRDPDESISLDEYWKKMRNNASFDMERWCLGEEEGGEDMSKIKGAVHVNKGLFNKWYKKRRVGTVRRKKNGNSAVLMTKNSTNRTILDGWSVMNTNEGGEKGG